MTRTDPEALRRRAEAMVDREHGGNPTLSHLDAVKLVHELRVHQTELEMQAEELADTQAALQASLGQYRDMYEHAPVGYVTVDRAGMVVMANCRAVSMLGREPTDVVGSSLEAMVDGAFRAELRAMLHGAFTPADGATESCRVSVDGGEPSPRTLKLTTTPVGDHAERRVVLTDVTALERERLRYAERLETIERMLRVTVDRELELIELKHALIARDAIIDQLDPGRGGAAASPAPAERSVVDARAALPSGMPMGPLLEDDASLEPTLLAFLNLLEDLESVEQLRKVTKMKNRFVALVSHELRTPLTSICGFTSTLLDRWDDIGDADRRKFLKIIDTQADRMRRLVTDLLILSRIEAGELASAPAPLDVATAVARAAECFPDAEIVNSCEPGLEAYADADHLHQSIVNYLSNAIKYGAPPIELTAEVHDAHVDIVVHDEGLGVPEEFVSRLFQEFAQARPSDPAIEPGTGLGLSIVRQLMQSQGGSAWYEPADPQGANFMLRLPVGP